MTVSIHVLSFLSFIHVLISYGNSRGLIRIHFLRPAVNDHRPCAPYLLGYHAGAIKVDLRSPHSKLVKTDTLTEVRYIFCKVWSSEGKNVVSRFNFYLGAVLCQSLMQYPVCRFRVRVRLFLSIKWSLKEKSFFSIPRQTI